MGPPPGVHTLRGGCALIGREVGGSWAEDSKAGRFELAGTGYSKKGGMAGIETIQALFP